MVSAQDFVTAGQTWQPPNASLFNAFVQTAINRERNIRDGNPSHPSVQRVSIQIKSSVDVAPGAVVGFGNPTNLVTASGDSRLDVIFGEAAIEGGRWAVAVDGINANAVENCALVGVAWAEVDVTDEGHRWADGVEGVLTSKTSGYAKILYKPSGTGMLWCCLQLGFDDSLHACLCELQKLFLENVTLEDSEITGLEAECGICTAATVPSSACFHSFEGTKPDELTATVVATDNVQPDPFGVNWSGFLTGVFTLGKIPSQLQCDRGNEGNEIDAGTITENYNGSLYAIGSPARIQLQQRTFSPSAGQAGAAQFIARFQINDGGLGFWSTWDETHVNYFGPTIGEKVKSHEQTGPYDSAVAIGGTIPPITSDLATITSVLVEP